MGARSLLWLQLLVSVRLNRLGGDLVNRLLVAGRRIALPDESSLLQPGRRDLLDSSGALTALGVRITVFVHFVERRKAPLQRHGPVDYI